MGVVWYVCYVCVVVYVWCVSGHTGTYLPILGCKIVYVDSSDDFCLVCLVCLPFCPFVRGLPFLW